MAFLAFRKSAIGCPRKLPALRAEVDVPAQKSAGAFSCLSSGQSPLRGKRPFGHFPLRSLAPPLPTRPAFGWARAGAPVGLPGTGLARGPQLRCPLPLTDYGVVKLSAFLLRGLLPPQRATRGPTPRFRGWEVYGCHPACRRGTRSLTTRNGSGHALGSAAPTCAGPPPASIAREIPFRALSALAPSA